MSAPSLKEKSIRRALLLMGLPASILVVGSVLLLVSYAVAFVSMGQAENDLSLTAQLFNDSFAPVRTVLDNILLGIIIISTAAIVPGLVGGIYLLLHSKEKHHA